MNSYKLTISYDGSNYYGWQKQPNVPTIQGTIEKVIAECFKLDNFRTIGSGRTDAGVHARKQVVLLETELNIEAHKLLRALNGRLPKDVRVREACFAEKGFHPIKSAKSKTYRYYFSPQVCGPDTNRWVLGTNAKIDIAKMRAAAKVFIGTHSFHNYFCVGSDVSGYVREIYSSEIRSFSFNGTYDPQECFYLEITGSGFLKQMVRLIFGTLLNAGYQKVEEGQILSSFEKEQTYKLSAVAPPVGLTLHDVAY